MCLPLSSFGITSVHHYIYVYMDDRLHFYVDNRDWVRSYACTASTLLTELPSQAGLLTPHTACRPEVRGCLDSSFLWCPGRCDAGKSFACDCHLGDCTESPRLILWISCVPGKVEEALLQARECLRSWLPCSWGVL